MVDVTATRDIDLYVITTDKDKYKIYKSYLQDDIIEKNLYDGSLNGNSNLQFCWND